MKKLLKALFVLLGMLFPATALAADSATSVVVTDVLQIAGYAVTLIVMALIAIAVSKVTSHFNVKIPDTWQSMMSGYLDKAVSYAEEWARNEILSSKAVTGNDKLETAFQFLMNIAGDDKRLTQMADDEVKQLIEAHLGQQRSFNAISAKEIVSTGVKSNAQLNLPMDSAKLTDGGGSKEKTTVTVPPSAVPGKINVQLMAIVAMTAIAVGACAWFAGTSSTATAVKGAINCMVGDLFQEASQYAPSLEANIEAVVDPTTGKVNWPKLTDVTGALKTDGAGCALKLAVGLFMKSTASTGSGAEPMQVDQESLLGGYSVIAAKQFPGKTFITQ